MRRVFVVVEGQTEETFVNRSVQPHLWDFDVHLIPIVVMTKRTRAGTKYGGGLGSWGQVRRDVRTLLRDSDVVAVSTLVDLYGLPADAPGWDSRPADPRVAVRHLESAMDQDIGDARVRCHIMLHEYETLLYADPALCGAYLSTPNLTAAMTAAVLEVGEPELVNDGPTTAPSKRLLAACPRYA